MSSSREEQEVVYEEEEVLWAKIRGYPWWPAFVDKVHGPVRGRQSEYTVFFFGDNTQYASSKLGASKLRKFYDHYTDFYQKARAHRKLMTSIQMAEEKLRQNDQNVEIFEELRDNLKNPKKDRPKSPLNRKTSRISEPDPEVSSKKEEPPELNKSKTYAHPRGRRSQAMKEQQGQLQEQLSSQKQKPSPAKQEVISTRQSERASRREQKKQQVTPSPPKRKKQPKEEIFEEPQQPKTITVQQKKAKVSPPKEAKASPPKEAKVSPPKQQQVEKIMEQQQEVKEEAEQSEQVEARSQSMQQQEGHSQESQDIVYQKRLRNKAQRSAQEQQRMSTGHRKRGRPKKRILRHHAHQQEKPDTGNCSQGRSTHLKRKIIHKTRPSPRKIQATASLLSQGDTLIVEHIRRILHRREQLVEYLGSITITIHNVQEILDLGVSNLLQDGQKTAKITEILFILRNVLLYKYFPEDVKHRKKYEQILRKKPITIRSDERQREKKREKEREQSEEQREEHSIRKKTIVKLQKFLKAHPDMQSKARELAVKIESYFERADHQVGDTYKSLAYKVLSSLKERKESCQQVMKKLDHHAYD